MLRFWRISLPFDYSKLDEQIEKLRRLAESNRKGNTACHGVYLPGNGTQGSRETAASL